jgi:MYXO-CTERM domain-containing protein
MTRWKTATLAAAMMACALAAEARAGSIWASDSTNGTASFIYELDSTTGAVLQTISGPGTFADAISFTPDGLNIWVLDSFTNSDVYRIDLTGTVLHSFSVSLDAEGLTILADGSLWIGGGNSGVIANVDPVTGAILSSFVVSADIFGMASNGIDRLYGLRIDGVIDEYDLTGSLLGSTPTGAAGTTLGLAASSGGGFFIASAGSTIYEVDAGGTVVNSFAGPGPFTEGLDAPIGIQVSTVPLPSGAALGLVGLALLALRGRRRTA